VHYTKVVTPGGKTNLVPTLQSGTDRQIKAGLGRHVHTTADGKLLVAQKVQLTGFGGASGHVLNDVGRLSIGKQGQTIVTNAEGRIVKINGEPVTAQTPWVKVARLLELGPHGSLPIQGGKVDSLDGHLVGSTADKAGTHFFLHDGAKSIPLADQPPADGGTKIPALDAPRDPGSSPGSGTPAPSKPIPGKPVLKFTVPTSAVGGAGTSSDKDPAHGHGFPGNHDDQYQHQPRHAPPAQNGPDGVHTFGADGAHPAVAVQAASQTAAHQAAADHQAPPRAATEHADGAGHAANIHAAAQCAPSADLTQHDLAVAHAAGIGI
jgi:hypothetical protein